MKQKFVLGLQAEQKLKIANEEIKKRNFFEALLGFSEAIGILGEPQFHLKRCECLMQMKDYEKAVHDAIRVIEIDKSYRVCYYKAMDCYLMMGDTQKTDEIMQKFREIAPNIDSIDNNQALKCKQLKSLREDIVDLFALNDYKKCLVCVEKALKIASANADLHFMKLRCLVILKQLEEAENANMELCNLIKQYLNFAKVLELYYDGEIDGSSTLFSKVSREMRKKVKAFDDVAGKAARLAVEMAKGEKNLFHGDLNANLFLIFSSGQSRCNRSQRSH